MQFFIGPIKRSTKRNPVLGGVISLLVIIILGVFVVGEDENVATFEVQKPLVVLVSAAEYVGQQDLSLIGNARAFTEAQVTAESSGRVTAVNVSLGKQLRAGEVVATLENASERAAVLQAEGAYEAALAAAAQSEVGVDQARTTLAAAENSVVAALQTAYSTTNNIVLNSIDNFFSSADSNYPALRISGRGFTPQLNAERVVYQSLLKEWQSRSTNISVRSDLESESQYAKQNVQRTIAFLDTFLIIFADQGDDGRYSEDELKGFITDFTAQKNVLIGLQSNLDAAVSGLAGARESLKRAELSASGGASSAADAQVKQALGILRAAQANLNKTILRTPISGTVNSLSVKTGDFINSFSPVAVIANNSALEIVTYVSEGDRSLIAIGDEVSVEGNHTGTITEIAPAVDSVTRKIEVRIATEATNIVNGDTVRITKMKKPGELVLEKIEVPLSAVKFEIENGYVFVVQENKLVARPVVLGVVRGGSVEVIEGLSATEAFVEDARGLQAGAEVEVSN